MSVHQIVPSLVDRIKQTLVALKMPRAIEILDVILRRLEHGEITLSKRSKHCSPRTTPGSSSVKRSP